MFLIASSNLSLSSIYSKKGELAKAIKFQEKAVKTAHSNNSRAENMVKLAYLHLKNGNIDQTNNIINDLKKDFLKILEFLRKSMSFWANNVTIVFYLPIVRLQL